MAGPFTVGMFINLEKDDEEKALRRSSFQQGLLSVDRVKLRGTKFIIRNADGDFLTQGAEYKAKAQALNGADLYFGSCRPTLEQLAGLPTRPIVIAGMFYAKSYAVQNPYPNYYGYISYDIGIVDKWYDLLNKMATAIFGSLTGIGVIMDSRIHITNPPSAYNEGAKLMWDAIYAKKPGFVDLIGVDQGQIFQQLKDFRTKYPKGVLLVPAATLTAIGRKRQKILDHIHRREVQLPALYPNRLYPTTTGTTSGGLLSYGVDLGAMYRKAGEIAGQLLLGQTVTKGLQLWTQTHAPETALNYNAAKSLYGFSEAVIAKLVTDAPVDLIISDEE